MKTLAITGRIAEGLLRRSISESSLDVDVLALPVSVAAFITPQLIVDFLQERDLSKYGMILLPGMVRGDVSYVERQTGIPTFLGTIHASEISSCFATGVELSKTKAFKPEIDMRRELVNEEIGKLIEFNLKNPAGKQLVIGNGSLKTVIGRGLPIPIIAEIVNAPKHPPKEVEQLAGYYSECGAGIIDLGMIAGDSDPKSIPAMMESIRAASALPISVDSLDIKELLTAAKSEVDLVISLDAGNMSYVASSLRDTPVVILPSNMKRGEFPKSPQNRIKKLIKNIEKAKKLGLEKIIADPVIEPPIQPGLLNSLEAYRLFREIDRETPLLIGVGNVTELIDVDSVGVNGILTAIAYEVEANLMLTPESSVKAKGSVKELATASKMMYLSSSRNVLPKDVGVDMLVLKEKRFQEYYVDFDRSDVAIRSGVRDDEFYPDTGGWFRIQVNREKGFIEAVFYNVGDERPSAVYTGIEATEIYQTIIRDKRIHKLDHAAYLGRELQKAEISLILNRSYLQDEPLFHRKKS